MDFELSDSQVALREEAREFARSEIEPRAIALDRAGEHPTEILETLGDEGYAGLTLPTEYGGRDEGLVELSLVIEELAAALMPVASALAPHLGAATTVERFGTPAQR
jgi:alkylation response protein AidB-like acyl-CoA dehydrogenase